MAINNFQAILTAKHPPRQSKFANYVHLGLTQKFFQGEIVAKCCKNEDDLYLYYIISGKMKVYYERNDHTQLELYHREQGNIFQTEYLNFASICTDRLRIVAVENTIVSAFTKKQLYELIQIDKSLFEEFLFCVHLTYATLAHRIINTAGLSSVEKILTWLNKMCSINEPDANGHYKLPCNLTQQEIADLLFVHVTTCNRLLNYLEKENLIKKTKNYIFVYDRAKLQESLENESLLNLENKK